MVRRLGKREMSGEKVFINRGAFSTKKGLADLAGNS